MRRRQVLAVLGGSATIGLAGCSNGDSENGNESNNSDDDTGGNGGDGNNGTDASPDLQFKDLLPGGTTVLVGTTVDIEVTVANEGGAEGTQTVEHSVGNITRQQEVTLEGGAEETLTFESVDTSELGTGEYTHTASMGDSSIEGRLTVREQLGGNEFIGRSTDGFVWFGEPDEETALDDSLALPPQEEAPDPVVVIGEISDGTWESSTVDFPPLDSLSIPQVPTVEAPNGFTGEFDLEAGLWTVNGQLVVTIPQEGSEDLVISFELNATTEESGQLSGSFERNGGTATVTIVDNETQVPEETGNQIIDGLLGLDGPAGQSGANWFELTLDIEFGDELA